MPRYDYQCGKCENIFEITRSISDSSDVLCSKCKSKDTKKLISIPAITFKGGGFYKTDSSNGVIKTGPVTAKTPASEKKTENITVNPKKEENKN